MGPPWLAMGSYSGGKKRNTSRKLSRQALIPVRARFEGKLQKIFGTIIPEAIKKIKVTPTKMGPQLEVELHDKVGVLRVLAKATGLLDPQEDDDSSSVQLFYTIAYGLFICC